MGGGCAEGPREPRRYEGEAKATLFARANVSRVVKRKRPLERGLSRRRRRMRREGERGRERMRRKAEGKGIGGEDHRGLGGGFFFGGR